MFSMFNTVELVNKQQIDITNIERIALHYIAEAITIRITDDEMLTLREYYNTPNPDAFAQISHQENSLSIRHGERGIFSMIRGYVELSLPRSFFGHLYLKTISGKIEVIGKLTVDSLDISSTSGKIALDGVLAGSAVLSTVSGGIEVLTMQAEMDVHSTSGSIRIGKADGEGDFKTVSGAIDASFLAVTGDIGASSTSGRIRLAIASNVSYELDAKSVSGTIITPNTGTIHGTRHLAHGIVGPSPKVKFKMQTVSGRIEILTIS